MVAAVAPLYRVRRRAPRRVTRDPAAAFARIARTGIRTGEAVAAYGVRGPAPATYGKCRLLQEQNGCCPARYRCGGVASNFAEKGPARETSGHTLGHLAGPAVNDGFSCDDIIRHGPGFFLYPSSSRSAMVRSLGLRHRHHGTTGVGPSRRNHRPTRTHDGRSLVAFPAVRVYSGPRSRGQFLHLTPRP